MCCLFLQLRYFPDQCFYKLFRCLQELSYYKQELLMSLVLNNSEYSRGWKDVYRYLLYSDVSCQSDFQKILQFLQKMKCVFHCLQFLHQDVSLCDLYWWLCGFHRQLTYAPLLK